MDAQRLMCIFAAHTCNGECFSSDMRSINVSSVTIFAYTFTMKYCGFLNTLIFSHNYNSVNILSFLLPPFKKGSCQLLAKVCA